MNGDWIPRQAEKSLERLIPRIRPVLGPEDGQQGQMWDAFEMRLRREWERLFRILVHLYGWQYDFFYHLEQILATAARGWAERPA